MAKARPSPARQDQLPSLYGGQAPSDIRERARFVLRMGLGELIGEEESRPGMKAAFDSLFPPGSEARRRAVRVIRSPVNLRQREVPLRTGVRPPFQGVEAAGFIYVIGFGAYVKIGFTERSVRQRIAGLQTGCPEKLETYATLRGSRDEERGFHERFAALRMNGEWFRREGALADWIEGGCVG